ncbi:helix-turn-helix domain-containing protein [Mammaliicoccus stepanovicii]|uniref:Helicase Helix-turn-helix domain-containing protein n=1 Tax=Mammaliicoccus stepanovicii TaxID=643214 RepID=A0A239Z8B7_9STAP|nr:helix-turn-helix domain-containing protein [Mammaliicoccus stepanovicii]PNZ72685.1 hypothetical protein CD111_10415 [Mammaliicoccus stepanovicii]GGI39884.1 hypothetical protein GCM10010896_05600 [Mammaliicoccus stepanovicii]SNV67257.1 Uncharacterised protein [Mammaliicoccus stepanovicii]
MKDIILKTLSMKHEHKTEKSIYNILIGKKTHQTYFDATIEHLKLYYGCLPNLNYSDFENVVQEANIDHAHHTIQSNQFYSQAKQTVSIILLLIQMISEKKHGNNQYQPIINDKDVQLYAKKLYILIKDNQEDSFISEIYTLFELIETKFGKIYLHYLISGYEETSYTPEQIALLENISIMKLKSQLIEEYQFIQFSILDKQTFPILSMIDVKPPLHYQTMETFKLLKQTTQIHQLAKLKKVKEHTIHDHVIEMYIKGYLTDPYIFIVKENFEKFIQVFQDKPNQNLKYYYEALGSTIPYFEIKIMYVIHAMEVLNVTR